MKDHSKPAYPVTAPSANFGMTLREHYAGQMLAALISCPNYVPETTEAAVQEAVRMADTLIAELNK